MTALEAPGTALKRSDDRSRGPADRFEAVRHRIARPQGTPCPATPPLAGSPCRVRLAPSDAAGLGAPKGPPRPLRWSHRPRRPSPRYPPWTWTTTPSASPGKLQPRHLAGRRPAPAARLRPRRAGGRARRLDLAAGRRWPAACGWKPRTAPGNSRRATCRCGARAACAAARACRAGGWDCRGRSPRGAATWMRRAATPRPAWTPVVRRTVPLEGPTPRDVRRLLVRLARGAPSGRRGHHGGRPDCIESLARRAGQQQRDLHARLPRCSCSRAPPPADPAAAAARAAPDSGATRKAASTLSSERLARSASYSPGHLIRIYREVFDETPSEYAATRLRSKTAPGSWSADTADAGVRDHRGARQLSEPERVLPRVQAVVRRHHHAGAPQLRAACGACGLSAARWCRPVQPFRIEAVVLTPPAAMHSGKACLPRAMTTIRRDIPIDADPAAVWDALRAHRRGAQPAGARRADQSTQLEDGARVMTFAKAWSARVDRSVERPASVCSGSAGRPRIKR